MKAIYLLAIVSMLFLGGCDIFDTHQTKKGAVTNFEDNVSFKKSLTLKESNATTEIETKEGLDYLQIVEGLDSNLFALNGNKVKLTISPSANTPQDQNGDSIYEVKLYGINTDKSDFIMLVQITISGNESNSSSGSDNNNSNGDDNSSSGNGDNNNSTGNGDDNSSSGDNNNSNGSGGDNNNSNGGSDNNNSNGGDNNNSNGNGGDDNNNSNGGGGNDNNSSGGGDNTTPITDSDNDYIPDNIETVLNKDSSSDDENQNGIVDGLEGDPFFQKQWYIKADGTATNPSEVPSIVGNDLNLLDVYHKYMGYNRGNPIILQIVDSGVDIDHEDLKANIDLNRSLNGAIQGDPQPGGYFMPHGTMLSGIAAARAFNGIGVRGVAPFAKIAGSNWLVQQSLDGLDAAWLSGNGANEIAVTNNSWGTYYTIDTFYEEIMQEGVKNLRDGKGRVYVFASGNARAEDADANTQYVINNRFALVVSGLNHKNRVAEYSTPGANVWISAYGGASDFDDGPTIATSYPSGESTKTWDSDTKKNYTYAMAGTSAAAPMVTGAVALLLEACPNLGWRDVKYVLAKTAKKVDSENSRWLTNGAGLHFNRNYGFGLIDTKAAIDMCQNSYANLPSTKWIEANVTLSQEVNATQSIDMNISHDIKIEWVEATIDIDSQDASDLDIYITSPSGTKVQLIQSGTEVDEYHIPNGDWMSGGFRFSTGALLDESSSGQWSVSVVNSKGVAATLKSVSLKIYGY